ncbi:trimeric intracellular cation channel family protein [Duganella violaceipulchra]|uniref:Membrane protein YeiH n=1 Tax=Duganella violaceipulchra TaxID=2849652 RepID=A0AA41L208_9BURK|nr:trimeric intracellular cation channel family protein [Duganella violaceicalia]MBV6319599.1 trimeric intracellular cation channel family protein [Duganella violaceicalia]MCP2006589.1 putative membrane protein YeiH [Duganella violaceicalia]
MLFYILDLIGVAVFAASGTLAAMASHLDLLGIMVLAAMTAIGGGTVRDLLLNRHPVFWIEDPKPLLVIVASAVFTIVWVQVLPVPTDALLIADALGLALFAMSGAKVAEAQGCRALIVILMGTLTGVGGGLVRDILAAKVPLILRQDIYATAAIAGILLYILLKKAGMPPRWAFGAGLVSIVVVRLLAIQLGLRLPSF